MMRNNPVWLSLPGEALLKAVDERDSDASGQAKKAFQDGCASPTLNIDFDVIVIGSGYGGAVAAARLSEMAPTFPRGALAHANPKPFKVCVLERGLEYVAGSFPSTFAALPPHVRMSANQAGVSQSADALFDLHLGGDVWALTGNGLGGGSLINAAVCEPASAGVLRSEAWPLHWRMPPARGPEQTDDDAMKAARWAALYERASNALEAAPWQTETAKSDYMQWLGKQHNVEARAARVAIVPPVRSGGKPTQSNAGVELDPCTECGDCFTGCNHNAKRTLSSNYLARAYRNRAALYTGVSVRSVLRDTPKSLAWDIRCVLTDEKKTGPEHHGASGLFGEEFSVRARYVVIAAGTYGSTELLMRSQQRGLKVSSQLGEGFSANGDFFGARYNGPKDANNAPKESTPHDERCVGPTITRIVDLRPSGATDTRIKDPNDPKKSVPLVVEEISVPAALRRVFEEILTTAHAVHRWSKWDLRTFNTTDADPLTVDDGAINRSMLYATMGQDSASGRLVKLPGFSTTRSDGGLAVHWPNLSGEATFACADSALDINQTDAESYITNPLWRPVPAEFLELDGVPDKRIFTTHPLGGCRMADKVTDGVVDGWGRVYSGQTGDDDETHDGLFVLDGSIIPLSLGINPLLTITALAEGIVDRWAADFGWVTPPSQAFPRELPTTVPTVATQEVAVTATSLGFSERMSGPHSQSTGLHPAAGNLSPVNIELTADFTPISNLHAFLKSDSRSVELTATLRLVCGPLKIDQSNTLKGLTGTVQWFERERRWVLPRVVRVLWAYRKNRLCADIVSNADRKARGLPTEPLAKRLVQALRTATTVGDVRLLKYEFEPLNEAVALTLSAESKGGARTETLQKGAVLYGAKRVEYVEASNPWRQLSEMDLMIRTPDGKERCLGHIEFDKAYMLGRYQTRLQLQGFRDAPSAWQDLFSMSLYMLRVITSVHFWSFRAADLPIRREYQRLPCAKQFPDADYHYEEISVAARRDYEGTYRNEKSVDSAAMVALRLTRITRQHLTEAQHAVRGNPIILFHGFGSGGIQFTHDAIEKPLARYLADECCSDIFVAELRTSIGLATSHQQWTMDEVALTDIPALIHQVLQITGAQKVRVVAHCIGSAMFCMAVLSDKSRVKIPDGPDGDDDSYLSAAIESAVLLQVGPIIRLPEENRARAYAGRWLARLGGMTEVSSSTDSEASAYSKLAERFIGTYSYPASERDFYRLTGDLATNRGFTNAHRSAAVFGRLFNMKNMTPAVLDAMGDLLAHCNLKTYSQTIHYTFLERLTDYAGQTTAYVTDENVRERMNFPVCFIHGEDNSVFARDTTADSQKMINRIHPGRCERIEIEGFGHLDPLVGKTAAVNVFRHIRDALNKPTPESLLAASMVHVEPPKWQVYRGSVGPWIGWVRPADPETTGIVVRIGLIAFDRLGTPPYVASQVFIGDELIDTALHDTNPTAAAAAIAAGAQAGIGIGVTDEALAVDVRLDANALAQRQAVTIRIYCLYRTAIMPQIAELVAERGFAELISESKLQTLIFSTNKIRTHVDQASENARTVKRLIAEREPRQFVERATHAEVEAVIQDFEIEIARLSADRGRIDGLPEGSVVLDANWLQRFISVTGPPAKPITFALSSCRLAPAVFDRQRADTAMGKMLAATVGDAHPLDFALLVGDQVYVDSTAGQFDPIGGDYFRFREVYREAWSAPNQQAVMRRIPCYFMFDDHEAHDY